MDERIDLSSLYRSLKLFVELGLVVSATTEEGETYYEISRPYPHHHLHCRNCGAEFEVPHELVQPLFDEVRARYGYQPMTAHLMIGGLCADCAEMAMGISAGDLNDGAGPCAGQTSSEGLPDPPWGGGPTRRRAG